MLESNQCNVKTTYCVFHPMYVSPDESMYCMKSSFVKTHFFYCKTCLTAIKILSHSLIKSTQVLLVERRNKNQKQFSKKLNISVLLQMNSWYWPKISCPAVSLLNFKLNKTNTDIRTSHLLPMEPCSWVWANFRIIDLWIHECVIWKGINVLRDCLIFAPLPLLSDMDLDLNAWLRSLWLQSAL